MPWTGKVRDDLVDFRGKCTQFLIFFKSWLNAFNSEKPASKGSCTKQISNGKKQKRQRC